jgi:hypothetical protein
MAQELKPGEQVTVKREVPFSRQSGAYKLGIKQVTPVISGKSSARQRAERSRSGSTASKRSCPNRV